MKESQEDENDAVWKLLGEARQPTVSPFFSRNVIREIRAKHLADQGGHAWGRWRGGVKWGVPFGALACAAILGWFVFTQGSQPLETPAETASVDDFETIANLDQLIASEDQNIWLDTSLF